MFLKKIKTVCVFYSLFVSSLLLGQSDSIDKALNLFLNYESSQKIDSEDATEAIFKACNIEKLDSSCSIQRVISLSINALSGQIKKVQKKSPEAIDLKQKRENVKRFRLHVRKHRIAYDFLGHARLIERRYKYAFNNEHVVEEVYHYPDLYDYSPKNGDSLMKFLQLLLEDLGKTSRFETKMHSRYGRLKALNYSFKIECIKVRNEILFHPWYRYRLHRGSEFLGDALSPIVYMTKVVLHVVPSIFCIAGLTASTALGGSGPNQD